ncbi:TD and POZ domain-containing protein 2-like [Chironomus tepperi]|uniref:TD and POZ domain-containing protein 2-like n=1 Tax=Chironomus tepperi TaxID=113505 RepID=UPI00391F60B8
MLTSNWIIDKLVSKKITQKINGNEVTLDLVVNEKCILCNGKKIAKLLCCEFDLLDITISQKLPKINNDLKTDLEKALFNEDLSDFTFILDNTKIPVSRLLLSARSPVFNRMFNSDFKEKGENSQVLETNMTSESFKELIRYIYIGEVNDISNYVYDLLEAAEYYQIDGLKTICEEELLLSLSLDTAKKIFQVAHLYRCRSDLIDASYSYIQSIFKIKSYEIPDKYKDNPSKINALFEKLAIFEEEFLDMSLNY